MKNKKDGQRKNNKLQVMSNFATMRFELKQKKLYQGTTVKKPLFSRFSKAKPKVLQAPSRPASINNTKDGVHSIQQITDHHQQVKQDEEKSPFRLKYLQKLSNQHLLIGNQYQLDMLKVQTIKGNYIDVDYKWSICPSELISSISVDPKYSMIAVSLSKSISIMKYNLKRQQECPAVILKHNFAEEVQYVRFVRGMSLFVVLQSKIQFYRINIVCELPQFEHTFSHKIDYGPNFRLYHVPQAIDNTLILYFYENRVKQEQRSKFGLWMQHIQSHSNQPPTVGKMILNYNIKVSERKEFSIFNYNKDICLIKFRFNIIAVKNGFVIDQTNTNFHSQNSFIEIIESSKTVVHFRKTFMDVYQLSMNFEVKPEVIKLDCLDSIAFQPPPGAKLFKIIELQPQTYAFFYEFPAKSSKDSPILEYKFCISNEANLMSKIDMLYPKKEEIQNGKIEEFQDTCNEAKKLGMNTKEVYYELWRRSEKSNKIDFQILIATEDYPTIEREVERKLKAYSMSIREVINIYTEALDMLKNIVKGPKCTVNSLIYYSSCQFTLKKFEMLRHLLSIYQPKDQEESFDFCEEKEHVLFMTIKDYYEYSDMSVVNQFLEQMGKYLLKKSPLVLAKLKAIINYFKLTFRLEYIDIIDKIINTCKMRFIEVLKEIPELLPFQYEDPTEGFGLWQPISNAQKEENLFLDELVTIDNRDQVAQFPSHIWFRRHINNAHGVILIKKDKIDEYIEKHNNKENIFYKVLCLLYNLKIYDQNFRSTINHIENHYPLLPAHLRGKFELYVILYEIFESFHQTYNLEEFLRYKECQLFKMYFERERIEKGGFILKKIMPLYENVLSMGKQIFNEGLYNYFSSKESSVSDLKSILNKLNNEKNEFHIKAEKMYEVLVNAIMKKIKIGTENDTPIDQILVYIENIPFPIHNHSIMMNLQYIQQINYESQMLKKVKVNMTLQQIVDNPKKVIQMMVQYEVQRHQITKLKTYRSLKVHTYKILAQIQCRKSNIYGGQEHSHALKIYLIAIMVSKEMIQLCYKLLKDEYLVQEFNIYKDFVEEIAIILYHWKLAVSEGHYLDQLEYLKALALLMEENSSKRKFIEYSIRYAQLMSFDNGYQIDYPLFSTEIGYPTLNDFTSHINSLSAKEMVQLDLQSIFDIIIGLKKLQQDEILQSQQLKIYQKKLKVQVYEQLIIRLIEEKELKSALDNFFILQTLPRDYYEYNIVFVCLIIENLLPELLKPTIALITKLVSYYYNHPLELAQIIQHLFSKPFSNLQLDTYLQQMLQKRQTEPIFSSKNPIINERIKQLSPTNSKQINILFELCLQRIVKQNELYIKVYHLHIMYRLMCHNPLTLAKYFHCKKKGINLKTFRSFVSFMALEALFDHRNTITKARQIFEIIYFQYTHNIFFSEILKWKNKLSFQQMIEAAKGSQIPCQDEHPLELIEECIEIFQNKLSDLDQEQLQQISDGKENTDYNLFLVHPEAYFQRPLSQYIYKDKDDGYENRTDELNLPVQVQVKTKQSDKNRDKFSSIDSKELVGREDSLVVKAAHRPRKYTEYFPEMFDVQQLAMEGIANVLENVSSSRDRTPRQRKTFDFNTLIDVRPQIIQDDQQIFGSYACINIGQLGTTKRPSKDKNSGSNSPVIFQNIKMPSAEGKQLSIDIASCISQGSSKELNSEPSEPSYHFNIHPVQEEAKHMPIGELHQKLLSTVVDNTGRFDLTLLKIQSHKAQFFDYLVDLLREIYQDTLTNFQKRLNLIIAIAEEYRPKYFQEECILIFRKLMKSKIIHSLTFKIIETVPIDLIFQQNEYEAFKLFSSRFLPKIDSISIYQAMEYVKNIFENPLFVDQFLMDFIVMRVRDGSGSPTDKEKMENIVMTLFDYLKNKEEVIDNCCQELSQGGEEDLYIVQTLRRLSLA